MKDCCKITNKTKKCKRKDGKVFSFPRRFTKKKCLSAPIKGFSMRSSCAPYTHCKKSKIKNKNKNKKGGRRTRKKKPQFLYHPNNPDKSFDVYIDKNPNDTIPIKYTTYDDVKRTIKKLERLFKKDKYSHKRIWQVGMILYVRLKVLKKKKQKEFKLSEKYFKFLGKRTKEKNHAKRKKLRFIF